MLGFEDHDHKVCVAEGISAAQAFCAKEGLKFTPVRRRVLEILLAKHTATGAYDILDILREEGLGAQPPVAYRALDFLVKHGFAHKIERLNAFVACTHIGTDHAPVFLICNSCDKVAEASAAAANQLINTAAQKSGFVVDRVVAEATGVCPDCADATS